jgi:hypothetical protein
MLMQDAPLLIVVASTTVVGLSITSAAALKGWQEWLALKRLEISARRDKPAAPSPTARIEVADLKERIRKLEAIANGIDY